MELTPRQSRLRKNLLGILERIAAAAGRAGRSADDVTLIAITKYVDAGVCRDLVAAGSTELGESRPQELWSKNDHLSDLPILWHLVGHLQRNKVERTLPIASLIHSVDSQRLLQAINAAAEKAEINTRVLLEVNTSGEAEKHGISSDETHGVLLQAEQWPHVRILGLMTMAARDSAGKTARACFAQLRELRDKLAPNCPPNVQLTELSMGMSGDFEEAIAEGATIVRVGSAIFEGVRDSAE